MGGINLNVNSLEWLGLDEITILNVSASYYQRHMLIKDEAGMV